MVAEGLSPATLSRAERGFKITEKTARAIHAKLAPGQPFEEIFELGTLLEDRTVKLSWEDVSRYAVLIGRRVLKEFQPHFLITFAGPSSLFTSLVMAKTLSREEFLRTTVYLALFQGKRTRPSDQPIKRFDRVDSHRFIVQVPHAIAEVKNRASKRIAIIDDTTTTGSVGQHIKAYLVRKGYRPDHIQYATCVCSEQAFASPLTAPDVCGYKAKGAYRMPWGEFGRGR
jgi:hypothetical protein